MLEAQRTVLCPSHWAKGKPSGYLPAEVLEDLGDRLRVRFENQFVTTVKKTDTREKKP